jgi:hypothetical protein
MIDALEASGDADVQAACRRRAEAFSLERCVEAHLRLYEEVAASD